MIDKERYVAMAEGHEYRYVEVSRRGPIAVLTLCRPPVNAIDDALLSELYARYEELAAATDVGAVVVRSRQAMFCPGVDIRMIRGFLADSEHGADRMVEFIRRIQGFYQLWYSLPVPTVAAMAGVATGGGLEFGLACDLRVASRSGRYGLPEAQIGLLPGAGGTQRLTRLAGPGVAARLILTAEMVSGEEAKALGIVQYCTDANDVERMALGLAEKLCAGSVAAARAIKRCIQLAPSEEGFEAEVTGSVQLLAEPRVREMVTSFLESRS